MSPFYKQENKVSCLPELKEVEFWVQNQGLLSLVNKIGTIEPAPLPSWWYFKDPGRMELYMQMNRRGIVSWAQRSNRVSLVEQC